MVTILRDAGLSALVPSDARVETLAEGFVFTEGPVWAPDGSLLFQDQKASTTYRVCPGHAAEVVRLETRGANGQTFARDGRLVFCEQEGRRISVMNLDGTGVQTVAETWSGQRLNSPNDIIARSDGRIYFTDPPYGVSPADRSLHFQGVYLLEPGSAGEPNLLLDDFEKPNGLALSPDERTLYICDTARYHLRAFDLDPSGGVQVGSSRVFARLDPDRPGGPDGVKVDRAGRVYVAVAQGIWVFDPAGMQLGILSLPKRPSNLAWCGPEGSTLAITAIDSVYQVRLLAEGVLPPFTPKVSAG
jgi:gluconolactonase